MGWLGLSCTVCIGRIVLCGSGWAKFYGKLTRTDLCHVVLTRIEWCHMVLIRIDLCHVVLIRIDLCHVVVTD